MKRHAGRTDVASLAGFLTAAAVVIFMIATGTAFADASTSPVTVRSPVVVDAEIGDASRVISMSRSQRDDWARDAASQMRSAAAARPGRIIALRPDAPLAFDALSNAGQHRVHDAWRNSSGSTAFANVRQAYESMLADLLEDALRGAGSGFDAAILGLPLEPASHNRELVSRTNDRYAAALRRGSVLMPAARFIYAGDAGGEWPTVRAGLSEALRLRLGRPIVYRVNDLWREAFGGASGTTSAAQAEPAPEIARSSDELKPTTSANEHGGLRTHSGQGQTNGGGSSGSGTNQEPPVQPEFRYYWAGTGRMRNDVDLSAQPLEGDRVVVLLQHEFGLYPMYGQTGWINGSVPQRANLSAHLAEIERDLDEAIPDHEWDGYGVIDYESWHPVWERTKEEYRAESRRLVREANPHWPADRVERVAEKRYERAARDFMIATLEHCQALRPRAKWGYWGFPRGYHWQYEQLDWMWEKSDAFYPSFYVNRYSTETPGNEAEALPTHYPIQVRATMVFAETFVGDRPVIGFLWHRYGACPEPHDRQPLNELDMSMMLDEPWDWPLDGLAIWDTLNTIEAVESFNEVYRDRYAPVITAQLAGTPAE